MRRACKRIRAAAVFTEKDSHAAKNRVPDLQGGHWASDCPVAIDVQKAEVQRSYTRKSAEKAERAKTVKTDT
ncbi:hypothetical protein CCR75_004016 [Bremia lactucae]|uniref:Uncharacterized protein n=1 Tax=Bremia lactucae TaxID=4779 RepID=A0A976IAW7_BRELC|nr:hypothetical protein CCR75_004016 [Bremia lactucae]